MTPAEVLHELLARLGANHDGAAVLVSDEELNEWPEVAVHAMKKAGLLAPASPASSVVCPGCERQCFMPVHTLQAGPGKAAFVIFCDKRDDISRVAVPEAKLRQWSASTAALAGLATRLLGVADAISPSGQRCEIGVVRGRKQSSHVVLVANGGLSLQLAGHTVALADYLTLEDKSFRMDKQAILRLVDRPIAGAGDRESAQKRRERLRKLVQAEEAKGNKAFLKTVAEREGISVSRLKQILQRPSQESQRARRSVF